MSVYYVECLDCRASIEEGRTYRWGATQEIESRVVLHAFELWPGYDVAEFAECAWQQMLPDFPLALPLVY